MNKTSSNKNRNLRKIHITFVMDKVTLREVLLRVLVVIIIPPNTTFVSIHLTLTYNTPTEESLNKLKIKDEQRLT